MMRRSQSVKSSIAAIDRLESRRLLSSVAPTAVTQTNFVSDGATAAQHTDTNLVNPWGIAITPTGNIWVANNGTGTSTFYDQSGNPQSLVVSIPGAGNTGSAAPTGVVFNKSSKSFKVSNGTASAASAYIFASEDGTISGWAPSLDPTHATLEIDHSSTGDVFKGLALAGNKIFATDFHNNRIEVFDSKFAAVTLKTGAFTDHTLPVGFAPFGIQAVGSKLYVTYALQDTLAHDDVHGTGNGFVDEFSTSGKLIKRIASNGALNSPWAVVVAPKGWGKYTGDLLVGNFGAGHITVYDKKHNNIGQLADSSGNAIVIDGLWGLAVGVKTKTAKQQIFFAAGTNDESDGLFGVLTPTVTKAVASTGTGGGHTSGY